MSTEKFLENLESYGIGGVAKKMTDIQLKIVDAVRNTGLKGQLKLILSYRMAGANGIEVTAKVSGNVPEPPLEVVKMFVDDGNILHENDPRQMNFDDVNVIAIDKKINQA